MDGVRVPLWAGPWRSAASNVGARVLLLPDPGDAVWRLSVFVFPGFVRVGGSLAALRLG
jgi:hypothetical protein